MADETSSQEADRQALAKALKNAKLQLDDALGQLGTTGALGGSLTNLRSAADPTNSSCNTACSCSTGLE